MADYRLWRLSELCKKVALFGPLDQKGRCLVRCGELGGPKSRRLVPTGPATNNEAERALRWAVLYRKITFGTRTTEGSTSYAAMLSIIETCRLRNIDPWDYIAMVLAQGRKGIVAPLPGL